MIGKDKIHRGGAKIAVNAGDDACAAQNAGERVEDAGAPRHAGGDAVGGAEAREGASSVQEGRLLVALKVGDGAPVDLVDRVGVQFKRVSHPKVYNGRTPRGCRKKKNWRYKVVTVTSCKYTLL